MRNRQFDEAIRCRIRDERVTIRPEAEARLREKIDQQARIEPRVRRVRRPMRLAVAVLAAVMLITGTALAATYWGSLEMLTHTDDDGQPQVNEALVEHIQPVRQGLPAELTAPAQQGPLTVDMADAVFDGNVLTATWTLTNNTQEQLYLLGEIFVNGERLGGGEYRNVSEVFIEPGEALESGISARIDEMNPGVAIENCDVEMKFIAFTPNGEVVKIEMVMGEDGASLNYQDQVKALLAEGKVPLAPDGVIEMGAGGDPALSPAENLIASGLMSTAGEAEANFSVTRNTDAVKTPDQLPIEKDNGAYTLRVTLAEVNLNSAVFHVERVFANREAAEQFRAYFDGTKVGPYWGFEFRDEAGDIWWNNMATGGHATEEPREQPDGTFVWGYRAEMTNLIRIPNSITVVPVRDDLETGKQVVPFPEEAIEFAVK